MPPLEFHPNKTSFDAVNALAMAKAAALAYKPKADVLKTLASWGFPRARFFASRGTEGFVAARDDLIVVAYRGTQEREDVLADAKLKMVPGKGGGHVHRGFKAALEAVSADMAAALRSFRDKNQPVFVTGHSLGAALAGLAVGASRTEGVEIAGLYTFGMPRIGNKHFAAKFQQAFGKQTFRLVNNNDIVTRVPPRRFGYEHVGVVKYFDSHGELLSGQKPWKAFLSRLKGQLEGRLGDFLKPGTDGIKDHSMKKYVALMKKLRG